MSRRRSMHRFYPGLVAPKPSEIERIQSMDQIPVQEDEPVEGWNVQRVKNEWNAKLAWLWRCTPSVKWRVGKLWFERWQGTEHECLAAVQVWREIEHMKGLREDVGDVKWRNEVHRASLACGVQYVKDNE